MTGAVVLDLAREGIWVMILVAAPMMIVGLVVGVVIALFQALTQIQEMTLVFVPKILGVMAASIDPVLRRGCGGISGLVKSLLAESLISALLSPIMMLIQSRFVLDVFLGRDSGWKAHKRTDEAPPLD